MVALRKWHVQEDKDTAFPMAGQRFPGIHSGVKLPRGSFCVACPVQDADGSHERGGRGGSPRMARPGTGGVVGEACVPAGIACTVYTHEAGLMIQSARTLHLMAGVGLCG